SHLQAIFQTACQEGGQAMQSRYDIKNPPAFERLLKGGVQLRPFAEEIMKGAHAAAQQILADQAAKDPSYRKIYGAWETSRKAQAKWFGAAEPVGFTSAHRSWHYVAPQSLPRTDAVLAGLFDMRLPLTFSLEDCDHIGRIIAACAPSLAAAERQ
ncbi:MAG: hypothetical protein ABGW82_14055, partial [Paracoccus sp. (in: a-proteobacteria)]